MEWHIQMIEDLFKGDLTLSGEPVFVVGFPRSGTTLLQSLLATQTGFISFPETHFFLSVYPLIKINDLGRVESGIIEDVYTNISEKMGIHFSDNERNYINKKIEIKELYIKVFFELIILKCIIKYNKDIDSIDLRWIEKTPYHAVFLDKIFDLFPEAKVIHIIRDPLKAIISRKQNFSDEQDLSYEALAYNWIKFISIVEKFEERFKENIFTIRYEDLTESTSDVMRKILHFLQSKFDENKLVNFRNETRKITLDWELWKSDNKNSHIHNMNTKYNSFNSNDPELREAVKILEKKSKDYYQ